MSATTGVAGGPMTPIFGVDESQDVKTFYHNVAYKANRMAINVEKMKILKERLGDCVRTEGVNYIEKCEQLAKRYEAAVRVAQSNSSAKGSRARNVGNILEKEKEIKQQLQGNLATA